MGFWVFMLLTNMLIPFVMIGFGNYFYNRAPKEVNMFFGYRTTMSMKNEDTWVFAHHHCGKLWRVIGWIMLPLSVAAMFFVMNKDAGYVGVFGGALCMIQCVFLIVSIIPTEIALKKTFDEHGNRRS